MVELDRTPALLPPGPELRLAVSPGSCESPHTGHLSDRHRLFIHPSQPRVYECRLRGACTVLHHHAGTRRNPHEYRSFSPSIPAHHHAWTCTNERPKLTPLLTPESGRHSPAELALFPPGWVRPRESLAVAKRATTAHRAWPCGSLVKLFATTNISECDTWVERLRPTLRRSRSIPAIAMPPQTSSMRTSGAFGGGKGICRQ